MSIRRRIFCVITLVLILSGCEVLLVNACPGCGGAPPLPESTPLTDAVISGDIAKIDELLSGNWLQDPADPNKRIHIKKATHFHANGPKITPGKYSPLGLAVLHKDYVMIETLLKNRKSKSKSMRIAPYGLTDTVPDIKHFLESRKRYNSSPFDQVLLYNEPILAKFFLERVVSRISLKKSLEVILFNRKRLCEGEKNQACYANNDQLITLMFQSRSFFSDVAVSNCLKTVTGLEDLIGGDLVLQHHIESGCSKKPAEIKVQTGFSAR